MQTILQLFKEIIVQNILFILNIQDTILSNLEEENSKIVKQILRNSGTNAKNLKIGAQFMDHGATEEKKFHSQKTIQKFYMNDKTALQSFIERKQQWLRKIAGFRSMHEERLVFGQV